MTTFALGEAAAMALGRVAAGSSGAHTARRGGEEAGSFEDGFFAVPAKGENDRLLRLARAALDAGRRLKREARREGRALNAVEQLAAAMTAGAVRVYEELCALARLNKGRVYPSYDGLARATALGRATVARAIAVLKAAGFLEHRQRFRRIEGTGPGPRIAQTSNVYRTTTPRRLLALLPNWRRPAPMTADVTHHGVNAMAIVADERDQRTPIMVSATPDTARSSTNALRRALAALAVRIETSQRESHHDGETLTQIIRSEHHELIFGTPLPLKGPTPPGVEGTPSPSHTSAA